MRKLTRRLSELKDALLKQNCSQGVIESGIQRAIDLEQSEMRRVRQRSEDSVVTLVSTFNPKKSRIIQCHTAKYDDFIRCCQNERNSKKKRKY